MTDTTEKLREENERLLTQVEVLAPSTTPSAPAPVTVQVSPGAVEALANYQQADMDGIMVLVSRQAIEECLPALRALAEQEGD